MVGGIGMVVDNAAIPSSLWSATLRHGYVGCMRDLVVNGNAVDLAAFARQQDSGNDFNLLPVWFFVMAELASSSPSYKKIRNEVRRKDQRDMKIRFAIQGEMTALLALGRLYSLAHHR